MARRRLWMLVTATALVLAAAVVVAVLLLRDESSDGPAPARAADEPLAYLTGLPGVDVLVDVDGGAPLPSLALAQLLPGLTGGALTAGAAEQAAGGRAAVALTGGRRTLALVAPDAADLRGVDRAARPAGAYRGARLFGARGAAVAVRGATLLAAPTLAALRRALDARAAPPAFVARTTFERRLQGLPAGRAAVRVGFDPRRLLSERSPALAESRWGRSLRGGAAVLVTDGAAVRVPFRVRAEPVGVTAQDLPAATGRGVPSARGRAPLVAGLRTLGQLARFATAAGLEPFVTLARLPGPLRPDLAGLSSDATLTSGDGRRFTARTVPPDPGDWARKLGRLDALSGLIRVTGLADARVDRVAGGAYTIEEGGRLVARAGVFGRVLVLSTDPRADLRAAATAPAQPAPRGADGALTLRLAPGAAERLLLGGAALPGALLDRLGDVVGWARFAPAGVTGELRLPVR